MKAQLHKKASGGKHRVVAALVSEGKPGSPGRDPQMARLAATHAEARNAERRGLVATAAYYRAEKRGFEAGHELEDWLAAEAEIAASLLASPSAAHASSQTRSQS